MPCKWLLRLALWSFSKLQTPGPFPSTSLIDVARGPATGVCLVGWFLVFHINLVWDESSLCPRLWIGE